MIIFFIIQHFVLTNQEENVIEFTLQNSKSAYTNQLIELNSTFIGKKIIFECFVEKYLTMLEFYQLGLLFTFHQNELNFSDINELLQDRNSLYDHEAIKSGSLWHSIEIVNLNQTTLTLHLFDFEQKPPYSIKFQMYRIKIYVKSFQDQTFCKSNCSSRGTCASISNQDQCLCELAQGSYCQFPIYQLSYVHPLQFILFSRSWAIINLQNLSFETNHLEMKFKGALYETYYYYLDFRSLSILDIQKSINRSNYFAYSYVIFNITSETQQFLIFNLKDDILSINAKLKLMLTEEEGISLKNQLTYILSGVSACMVIIFIIYWFCCRSTQENFSEHNQLSQSTARIKRKLDLTFLNVYLPRQDYDKIIMLQPHLSYINECVICFDGLNERKEQCSLLPCGHLYHFKCIQQWLQKKNQCPQCKIIFKEEDFQQRDNILIEALQNPYDANHYIGSPRMSVLVPLGANLAQNKEFKFDSLLMIRKNKQKLPL